MLGARRFAVLSALLLGALALTPAVHASSAAPSMREFCPIALGIDPDSVTANSPSVAPLPGQPAVATVVASETPTEAGANAPTVRLRVYIHGDIQPADLLAETTGAFSKGPVSLSGPATGKFATTETISLSAPGTYAFDFLVLFDNGLHLCTSLLGLHPTLIVTVP